MKLLHLYDDLMNLYGEYANVSALNRYLTDQGIVTETDRLSLWDEIHFESYDLIYIGSGTENAQMLALKHLMTQKEPLKRAYDQGTIILTTGNAFELFGKHIVDTDGVTHTALNFFDFTTTIDSDHRITTDQICHFVKNNKTAVGYINKSSKINGITTPMFTVEQGSGNHPDDHDEGIMTDHFYGTHLIGPCLVKNPFLAEHFVRLLCEKAGKPFSELKAEYEKQAYEVTLAALKERKW